MGFIFTSIGKKSSFSVLTNHLMALLATYIPLNPIAVMWSFYLLPLCSNFCMSLYCQILVVIAAVFGIVIYRVITVSTFAAFGWALIRNNSQVATTGTAVCINFCVIMLLNVVSFCLPLKWYVGTLLGYITTKIQKDKMLLTFVYLSDT